jgi:hypothetical protein
MVRDTVTVLLKNTTVPYATADSSRIALDSLGQGTMKLKNSIRNGTYYLVIRHRNSIETWSTTGGLLFNQSNTAYNFTADSSRAYGLNMIKKGTKWCIFSGDVNQDGAVDALDMIAIDNDVSNFVSGYVVTDINGDQSVDALDMIICDNNNANFVSAVKPPGAMTIKIPGTLEQMKAIEKYMKDRAEQKQINDKLKKNNGIK